MYIEEDTMEKDIHNTFNKASEEAIKAVYRDYKDQDIETILAAFSDRDEFFKDTLKGVHKCKITCHPTEDIHRREVSEAAVRLYKIIHPEKNL